jgi:hypothetical protein
MSESTQDRLAALEKQGDRVDRVLLLLGEAVISLVRTDCRDIKRLLDAIRRDFTETDTKGASG